MSDEQKHTPEPWPADPMEFPHNDDGGWLLELNAADYERARLCVNACAGLNDPQTEITRMRSQDMRFSMREPAALRSQLEEAHVEIAKLRAECEAAAAYVSVIPISVGLTPQTADQYNAYIPYLTARTKGD